MSALAGPDTACTPTKAVDCITCHLYKRILCSPCQLPCSRPKGDATHPPLLSLTYAAPTVYTDTTWPSKLPRSPCQLPAAGTLTQPPGSSPLDAAPTICTRSSSRGLPCTTSSRRRTSRRGPTRRRPGRRTTRRQQVANGGGGAAAGAGREPAARPARRVGAGPPIFGCSTPAACVLTGSCCTTRWRTSRGAWRRGCGGRSSRPCGAGGAGAWGREGAVQ